MFEACRGVGWDVSVGRRCRFRIGLGTLVTAEGRYLSLTLSCRPLARFGAPAVSIRSVLAIGWDVVVELGRFVEFLQYHGTRASKTGLGMYWESLTFDQRRWRLEGWRVDALGCLSRVGLSNRLQRPGQRISRQPDADHHDR